MNLDCRKEIITDNLAIHIDLTNIKSWDLNTGFTAISLTKWKHAVSEDINLIDMGLTSFDNGRTDTMYTGETITPQDNRLKMFRVGYNVVENPTEYNTSGVSATTAYDGYGITGVTTGETGNYFQLNGGYLQGFFKLQNYNFELFPPRYVDGITIETIINIRDDSKGIFYLMGARSEDKYLPYFSGETTENNGEFDGVFTSKENLLTAHLEKQKLKDGFRFPEEKYSIVDVEPNQIENIENNLISFELTEDKKIAYKYIGDNGLLDTNVSEKSITYTGLTLITISFTPYEIIEDYDNEIYECYERRLGDLKFFVNGNLFWKIKDFNEFYFMPFKNDGEKQIGIPFNISWGGGSFGLKHSYHYDKQKYILYENDNTDFIRDNFSVYGNPFPDECEQDLGDVLVSGLTLSGDTETFYTIDVCEPSIQTPITVMRIEYVGVTGQTGTTGNTYKYFIRFNNPISVLSNREYNINYMLFNSGFFKTIDENNFYINSKISTIVYGTTDIEILDETTYDYPLDRTKSTSPEIEKRKKYGEYQYVGPDGIMYYGKTGLPVYDATEYYTYLGLEYTTHETILGRSVTGHEKWLPMKTIFKTKDNVGQQYVHIGVLIESNAEPNLDNPLFIQKFNYVGSDILKQDERKRNLFIERNFNSSYIGGIQKLRLYNRSLSNQEILHNAVIESQELPTILVNKGGRIIYRT